MKAEPFPTYAEMQDFAYNHISRYADFDGAIDGLQFWYGVSEDKAREITRKAIEAFDKQEVPA